jgi:hypothetical protein
MEQSPNFSNDREIFAGGDDENPTFGTARCDISVRPAVGVGRGVELKAQEG